MRALCVLIAAAGLLSGCLMAIPHPTLLHAERSGVALETLEHGRGLFVARCGNCHRAPDPGSRSSAEWAKLLPDMLEDSHLNTAEAAEVLAFLRALSKDQPQPATASR